MMSSRSPTKTSVEKPIKSLEEDSKADPILVKLIQEVKKEALPLRQVSQGVLEQHAQGSHLVKNCKVDAHSIFIRWEESVEKSGRICEMAMRGRRRRGISSKSGVTEDTAIASTWPYFDYMSWLDGKRKIMGTFNFSHCEQSVAAACGVCCRVWRVAAECGHHCEQSVACSCSVWRVAVAAEFGVWRHIVNTHAAAAPRHTLKPHAAVTIVNRA
uniref:Uncharacterized protein n=1 Tax=Ditylenchus dipsaci TaxID=166011 RepID=A0A915EF79_9BILA